MHQGRRADCATIGSPPATDGKRRPRPKVPAQRCAAAGSDRPRLRVCSLSVGGLDGQTYDHLHQWLRDLHAETKPHILMLQETHLGLGPAETQFYVPGYNVIATPGTRHTAGVATLIASSLCDSKAIRYRTVVEGRVLHVRLPTQESPKGFTAAHIDVINVYQHTWQSVQATATARTAVWRQVDSLLQTSLGGTTSSLEGT